MKTLVINGSPRGENSNTMKLVRAFLGGMGPGDSQVFHIADSDIRPCRGCFSCWSKTPGACVIRDGMEALLRSLLSADAVIWAFPLYYFSVPGPMKTLMDRQLPMNLPDMAPGSKSGGHPSRHDLSHQRRALISTCGFWTAEGNYGAVTAMFDRCFGAGAYDSIFCGQGECFRVPEARERTDQYLEIVRRAGAEFLAGGIGEDTKGKLAEPLFPRTVFEQSANASWKK